MSNEIQLYGIVKYDDGQSHINRQYKSTVDQGALGNVNNVVVIGTSPSAVTVLAADGYTMFVNTTPDPVAESYIEIGIDTEGDSDPADYRYFWRLYAGETAIVRLTSTDIVAVSSYGDQFLQVFSLQA